jgi:1-acyl-sn-glycerol-3-phosphate acyltransferase
MIQARHTKWAEWIFIPYISHLLSRSFYSVRLLGNMPETDKNLPLVLLPNHSTWWDGFFVHLLNRKIFEREIFLMMLKSQLEKFSFFSRLGAFGVELRVDFYRFQAYSRAV